MTDFTWEFVANNTTSTPVDSLWNQFKEKCIRSINPHVPSKLTSTRFSHAWCNRDVRRLSRRKKWAYKKARTTKQSSDWSRYKKIQKDTQHACRKAHDDFISNMVGEPGTNSKKLYTYIKSKKCDGSGVSPLKKMESPTQTQQIKLRF